MRTILRSPDAEGNTGGNPFAPSSSVPDTSSAGQSAPASAPASQPSQSSQPTSQPSTSTPAPSSPPPSAPAPQVIGLSQEQLQQILAARSQPAQPEQPPQISDDEFRQKFNIYTASEQAFERTFGIKPTAEQLSAYNEHLQSIARQAVTINRYLMDQKVGELQNQFKPVQQTIEQQKAQQYFTEFVGEYPGLKDYGPLLKEITDAAQARGMRFNSVGEAKTFVAAQAAKLLGKQVNDFKLAGQPVGGNNNQTTQPQSGARTMSTTSMGGRSGVSGGAAPVQSTAERLFSGTAT